MNKVWRYSVVGVVCAGGLYTGILNHVEKQVAISNQEKTAYMKKVHERNDLIKSLNGSNAKLYKLELTYNQITNATNQKTMQITALKSDISQIQNQIKTISRSIQSAHSSASAPVYKSTTGLNSTTSHRTTTSAPPVSKPAIVVSPAPPVVQTTTKASGS